MNEWNKLDMCEHACMCTRLYCPVKSIRRGSVEMRKWHSYETILYYICPQRILQCKTSTHQEDEISDCTCIYSVKFVSLSVKLMDYWIQSIRCHFFFLYYSMNLSIVHKIVYFRFSVCAGTRNPRVLDSANYRCTIHLTICTCNTLNGNKPKLNRAPSMYVWDTLYFLQASCK